MAQSTALVEPHIMPPPIPNRNHLRNDSAYQERLRTIKSEPTSSESAPSSPVSHTLFKEFDYELTETQQRLRSVILKDKNMVGNRNSSCWDCGQKSDAIPERRRSGEGLGDFYFSEVGFEVSYRDDHPEPLRSELSKKHSTTSSAYSRYSKADRSEDVEQIEVEGRVPTLRGSRNGTTPATHTNHTSCSENNSPFSDCSVEKMDTKVSDWLARGFPSPVSHEPDSPRQVVSSSDRPFPPRHVTLSLFPPTSPSTGNREYTPPGSPLARPACPLSPLNNGRDAYGNYIPSNKRDYFTAQSPPTSPIIHAIPDGQPPSEKGSSSPIVRLRGGGWNGFKPFWKTPRTEEPDRGPTPNPLQDVFDKDGILQDIPTIDYVGRPDSRAPRSMRSHFTTTRAGKIQRTPQGMLERPFAMDTRRDGRFHLEGSEVRQGPNTPDSADTDDSSVRRIRADAVLYQHFGPQLSPLVPTLPGLRPLAIREHPATYGRADVPVRDRPRSPPAAKTFASQNPPSALTAENNYMDSMSPWNTVTKKRPTSWDTAESQETQESDSAVRSHAVSPRDNKRWNRNNPPPPPQLPPPNLPRYLRNEPPEDGAFENPDDDSHRAPSTLSADTVDDKLTDLLGLKKTGAYRRVEHDRAVQRIQAERQLHDKSDLRHDVNVRRKEEVRQREPDLSTIVPDDSVTTATRRQPIERRHDSERLADLDEHHPLSSPSPSQYLPRHGRIIAKAQATPQKRNEHSRTIGYPSIVSASEPVGSASFKGQNSLQTVISRAGKLTRLILAAPSNPKYKTYSRRHPPIESKDEKQSGMGADATGWPRNGKSFSSATQGMLMSTQVPDSRIISSHNQPQNSGSDQKQSDIRIWELPRGRREKKAEKTESKRRGGKWRTGSKKETSVEATKVMEFASRGIRRGGSSNNPAANTYTAGPRGATQLQHPCFARDEPRARSLSPKVPMPVPGSPTTLVPVIQQPKRTFTPSHAAGTPQTKFGLPDSEGKCYVRCDDREVLPFNPALGYPHHWRLNTFHHIDNPDAATLKWLEGIRAQTDAIAEPVVNIGGGGSSISRELFSTNGEASSLTSHHGLLTSAATSLNRGNETIDSTDMDARLMSPTHLNLAEITHEAIASANRINGDNTRPSLDEANVRSDFSTDSTVELRRKKKAREKVWRNEDKARAMAMAMYAIG